MAQKTEQEEATRVDRECPSGPPTGSTAASNEATPTPEHGWPAQPALTAHEAFLRIVREDIATLMGVAASLEDRRQLRRIAAREDVRRTLAGVVAHCEVLRLALEKGAA